MLPVDREAAERIALGSDTITVLATSEGTSGAIFAVELRMPPGGGPPVMHRHAPSEIYHVLEGELTFYVGDASDAGADVRRVTATAGDVVPLDGNTPHTIRNEGVVDAVAFGVHSPGAVMEGFTRAVAARADESLSIDAVLTIAAEHGIEMLGPVPGLT